jgi:hypothetical protein
MSDYCFTSSTRRFCCRPSGVSFGSAGLLAPTRLHARGKPLARKSRQARYYRRAANALRAGDRSRAIRYLKKGDRASRRAAGLARRLNLPACA